MADLAITGISFSENYSPVTIKLGEAAAAFDVVYLLTGEYFLADATDAAKANAAYLLLVGGAAGQFATAIPFQRTATLVVTPALVQGDAYFLSANPGKIAPKSDLVTGNQLTELLKAASPTDARLALDVTGIAVP